jgi:hypothetical protein
MKKILVKIVEAIEIIFIVKLYNCIIVIKYIAFEFWNKFLN